MIKICNRILRLMLLPVLVFLTANSLISTQRRAIEGTEEIMNNVPIYKVSDNFLFHVITILLLNVIFVGLYLLFQKKNRVFVFLQTHILYFQGVISILMGFFSFFIFWGGVRTPIDDQIQVYSAALCFNEGNYINLSPGGYIDMYPQQLGYIFFLQMIFRLTGCSDFQMVQMLNCLLIAGVIFSLCLILDDLTELPVPRMVGTLLFCCMLPLYLLHTWVYGDIPSFLCAYLFLHFYMKFMRDGGKKNVLLCLSVLPLGVVASVEQYYQRISGYEVTGGIPSIAWITMGMIEGGSSPGWFNNYSVPVYYSTGCDREETKRLAVERLGEQINYFKDHPIYALSFWKRKITTQWNDPFYHTDYLIAVDSGETPRGVTVFIQEQENKILILLSLLQTEIYFGGVFYILFVSHKEEFYKKLPEVYFLGGFLFSLVWEANSRYVLPYYLILFPLAAIGWNQVICISASFLKNHYGNSNFMNLRY